MLLFYRQQIVNLQSISTRYAENRGLPVSLFAVIKWQISTQADLKRV